MRWLALLFLGCCLVLSSCTLLQDPDYIIPEPVIDEPTTVFAAGEHLTYDYTQGLVSWWSFDDAATDNHSSNDGTANGSGVIDTNFSFKGNGSFNNTADNGYFEVLDIDDSLDFGDDTFVINFWQYRVGFDAQDRSFSKGNTGGGGCGAGVRYEASYFNNGNWGPTLDDDVTKTEYDQVFRPDASAWVMITIIGNGTDVLWYFDGGLEYNMTDNTGSLDNACSLIIGGGRGSGDTVTNFHQAYFDEFAIWKNVTWNASYVTELYNAGNGTDYADVVASGAADSCTYSSGNWAIDCADSCVISSNTDLNSNNFTASGSGTLTLNANISNFTYGVIQSSCAVTCQNEGCFQQ